MKYFAIVLAACSATFACQSIAAPEKIRCQKDPVTRQYFCIDEANIRSNQDVRSSPVQLGGPERVMRTTITAVANCTTKVLLLRDSTGVNFAGGMPDATNSRGIVDQMCAIGKTRPDSKLSWP